jgi:tetratricopeptide (TPR) repeat protein
VSGRSNQQSESVLAGRRVTLIGKLASMPRRNAEQLIREHGGKLVERFEDSEVVIVSDESSDPKSFRTNRQLFVDDLRARVAAGEVEVLGESALWSHLGLVDSGQGVQRLYTPAMLAELVQVPIAVIRQWHRRQIIVAKREVQRLPYFDFEDVGITRKLAQLWTAGCSFNAIERQLENLARLLPETQRPLTDPAIIVQGRTLLVRQGDNLAESDGQLLIHFAGHERQPTSAVAPEAPATIPMSAADVLHKPSARPGASHPYLSEDLRALATELSGNGHPDQAIEAYRAVLFSGDSTAEDHFAVAELLYEQGDLPAARERYYVAIELEEDFVEARANLGCVLAELGDLGLAEAAFRGALEYHPDYADAHYHLARLLDRVHRSNEAICHWRLFVSLAPASPWADEARDRIAEG